MEDVSTRNSPHPQRAWPNPPGRPSLLSVSRPDTFRSGRYIVGGRICRRGGTGGDLPGTGVERDDEMRGGGEITVVVAAMMMIG
jgi:hypothetical protein